jgi:hypothetical protein
MNASQKKPSTKAGKGSKKPKTSGFGCCRKKTVSKKNRNKKESKLSSIGQNPRQPSLVRPAVKSEKSVNNSVAEPQSQTAQAGQTTVSISVVPPTQSVALHATEPNFKQCPELKKEEDFSEKKKSDPKGSSPQKISEEHPTSVEIRQQEDESVTIEELAIKTFEQSGRLHRTFNYHISSKLPQKPVQVVEKKEEEVVKFEKPQTESCFVVQQSCTCVHMRTSNDVAMKPIKQVSTTSIKACESASGNGCTLVEGNAIQCQVPINMDQLVRQLCESVKLLVEAQQKKD